MNDDKPRASNASRLRQEIDHGRTGDKVNAEDPSAVPLGTDDEAAGTAPSAAEVDQSLRDERRNVPNPAGRREPPAKGGTRTWVILVGLAVLLTITLVTLANWIG